MGKYKTWESFEETRKDGIQTKGDLAKAMKLEEKCRAFDYALPQNWLDSFVKKHPFAYNAVLSTTFWVYEKGCTFGRPVSGLEAVQKAIEEDRNL